MSSFIESFISPLGYISIEATDSCILNIQYRKRDGIANLFTTQCRKEILIYLNNPEFSFNIPLQNCGTEFQNKVWKECTLIPKGETRTYKQIAENINSPKASRAVGNALNKNPYPIIIPCHRIVSSNGNKLKYVGGENRKAYLLKIEKT